MMAARGKKRLRKDGSIADGGGKFGKMPDYRRDSVDIVSTAALSESLQFNLPAEFLSELDLEDLDGGGNEMTAIADRHGVDLEALEARTSKLIWFLKRRGDLEQAKSAALVSVDPQLLDYAASVPIRYGDDLTMRG